MRCQVALAAAVAALFAVPTQAAVVVSAGLTQSQLLPGFATVGVRFRQLNTGSSQELFVGHSDLGVGASRTQADLSWASANAFTISNAGGTLSASVGGVTRSFAGAYTASGAAAQQPFDTLQIVLRDGVTGAGSFDLGGLMLSGTGYRGGVVSSAALGGLSAVDGGGFRFFTVTGIDFRQDFTLTGTLNRSGSFGPSAELNRLDFTIGNGPITQPAIPEPATWLMMIAGFAFVGSALRNRRAKSTTA
jgi:PEP-CTERM motif